MNYIYIIESKNSVYKIGTAGNVYERMRQLQCGNPYKLNIFGMFKTCNHIKVEQKIHEILKEYRTHGEWFELNDFGVSKAITIIETVIRRIGLIEDFYYLENDNPSGKNMRIHIWENKW
jgi:hypothetical protein